MSKPKPVTLLLPFLHFGQACLACYGAYVSDIAITKLSLYEGTAQSAAEWSEKAKNDLSKTRKTQATGAIIIAISLLVSLIMAIFGDSFPGYVSYLASPAMLVLTLAARTYISNFWTPKNGNNTGLKLPIPGLTEFNEAQTKTEDLTRVLELLEWSWVGTSAAVGLIGY